MSRKSLNLRKKLWLIIGCAFTGMMVLIAMSLVVLKQDHIEERKLKTRHLVEVAHSVINSYYTLASSGKMTRQQAQAAAITAVRAMRYEKLEYFWINDMQSKVIMHPIAVDLNGKDMYGFKDSKGKLLFVEFIDTVRKSQAGFVFYHWPKPGFAKPVLKVSYVKGFEPWGWIVGSGIYLDDINDQFWEEVTKYTLAGVVIMVLILGLSWIMAKSIARNEEVLRISEDRLSKAFHASPDGIVISRKEDGLFVDANDAFCRILGYAREEIIGHTSLELQLWTAPRERELMIERVERDKEVRNFQTRLRVKSGEIRNMLWSSDVLILNGEECLFVVLRDITVEKANERQLLKSKAELVIKHEQLTALFGQVELVKKEWERTLDCIDDMVIQLDEKGRVKRCNRATVEFAGISAKDIIGVDWRELVKLEGIEAINADNQSGEFYHETLNRWFHLSYYPYSINSEMRETGSVVSIHETTGRKRAAMALEKAYAELKEAHSQMLQQEKMASIGQLAAGVAHEINNPTGFIMSNLSTMKKYSDRLISFITTQSEVVAASGDPESVQMVQALRKQLKIDHVLADVPNLITESLDGAERVKKIVQDLKAFPGLMKRNERWLIWRSALKVPSISSGTRSSTRQRSGRSMVNCRRSSAAPSSSTRCL